MSLNISDVEDSWSEATALFEETIAEFEMEWNAPMIEMMLALDMFVNQDIYLAGMVNSGNNRNLYGQQQEEGAGETEEGTSGVLLPS